MTFCTFLEHLEKAKLLRFVRVTKNLFCSIQSVSAQRWRNHFESEEGPKSIQFFHLQRITRSYKLTAIFVVLALATANAACR